MDVNVATPISEVRPVALPEMRPRYSRALKRAHGFRWSPLLVGIAIGILVGSIGAVLARAM